MRLQGSWSRLPALGSRRPGGSNRPWPRRDGNAKKPARAITAGCRLGHDACGGGGLCWWQPRGEASLRTSPSSRGSFESAGCGARDRSNTAEAAARGREVQKAKAAYVAANVLPIIESLRACGVRDLRGLAAGLNNRGVRTARGGRWHVSNVKNLVDRLPALTGLFWRDNDGQRAGGNRREGEVDGRSRPPNRRGGSLPP